MNRKIQPLTSLVAICVLAALFTTTALAFDVSHADHAPVVDGFDNDAAWAKAEWVPMKHLMWGTLPESDDFSGRYKLVWTTTHLYLLAEITDDILYDSHPDPLDAYWEDDALEIFIDENASGGDHLYTHNAFAYHISLDNQAADMGPFLSEEDRINGVAQVNLYPHQVVSQWKRSLTEPHKIIWEVQLSVVGEDFSDQNPDVAGEILQAGKLMGFMLAYCDSDGKLEGGGREHFMGDVEITPVEGDRNLGYKDASVFRQIKLVDN